MLAWRLCRERYAKFDGAGAARVGGRWNPVGVAMIYTAESDALAVLEARVQLPKYIPDTYVLISAEIPDDLVVNVERYRALPTEWRDNIGWTRSLGSEFVGERWSVALSVPSRIVPTSRNILLNPNHEGFSRVVLHNPRRFDWDGRLWERSERLRE